MNRNCRNFLLTTLIILITFLKGYSTHIVGGALTYSYSILTPNVYTVTMKLYRDMTGVAAPANIPVSILKADGSTYLPNVTLNPVSTITLPVVLPPCATSPSVIPQVEEYTYTNTVTILPIAGGVHLFYQTNARNPNATNLVSPGTTGEGFYAYIPMYYRGWSENFEVPDCVNGTTVDIGATAWTRTVTAPGALPLAAVNAGSFQIVSQNSGTNGIVTWASDVIPINTFTNGVNLSVGVFDPATNTLENGDSIQVRYSINGLPSVLFTTNGFFSNDFNGRALATASNVIGNSVQIFVRVKFDALSPNDEIYQFDMPSIYDNTFIPNSQPVFQSLPPLLFCSTNTFAFSQGALDSDGDVLVYTMFTPYTHNPLPTYSNNLAVIPTVTWAAGFSALTPFNSGGPNVTLNPGTGLMTGVQLLNGGRVFGIKCSEYRGGNLLSESTRDFEVIGVTCPPFVPAPPTAGAVNNPLCVGQTLSLTATFTPGATYNWTGPNSFTSNLQNPTIANVTLANAGTYSVSFSIGGCTGPPGTVAVVVNPTPATPTAASNSTICAGATLSLTALPNGAVYAWSGPNSFTSNVQNPTIIGATTLASGTYSVTQTLLGCTSLPGTTNVTVNPVPVAPTAASNSTICAGQNLNLTALPNGATSYSWSGPNSFTSNVQNPTIVGATTLASGTYSVSQTLLGCTSPFGTTNVTVNPIPVAPTAASNSTICAGQNLNLTALPNGATSYSWNGPNSFTSNVQNPTIVGASVLASGTYSVNQTVLGCTSAYGITNVTVNPIPATPTAASNSTICAGQNLNLTALPNGASSYSWTGPNSFTSNIQNPTIVGATILASGTYSVTQTLLGCNSLPGTTNVTVNPVPAAPTAASNSTICAGQNLSLTALPNGANSYSWTGPNSFTSNIQNPTIVGAGVLASGVYSVNQTILGCTSPFGTTNVTVNPIPAAPTAASNSTICAGQNLSLTANPGGAVYAWSGPNSFTSNVQNPTIVGATTLASGTYSVTQTLLGCTSLPGATNVTVNPLPAAPTAANNSSICAGQTLSLTALPGGGIYFWTGPNSFTSNVQNPTIVGATILASGTYSVSQTLLGCTGPFGTTDVTVNPIPATPTAASNSTICAGQTLSLTANPGGAFSYNWTGPNSFTSNIQNPTIAGATTLASGTYSVSQTVLGCTSPLGTTNVTVNPIPLTPTATNNSTLCAGLTLSLTANPGGAFTYSWTGPNSFTANVQNPTIIGATTLATGMYSVTQTVLGCESLPGTTSVTIVPPPSAPVAGSNSSLCVGATLSLTATFTPGAIYNWSGPNSFTSSAQNPTISPVTLAANGNYSIYIGLPGCAGPTVVVSVIVNPIPAAPTAANNSSICAGQTLSLTANPGGAFAYNWTGPNSFTSNIQNPTIVGATTLAAGVYSVSQTVLGCTGPIGTTSVTIIDTPLAPTAANNSTICAGGTLSLTANPGGGSFIWNGPNSFTSNIQNPVIVGATTLATGMYTVNVTVNGCTSADATTSVTIVSPPSAPIISSNSTLCAGATLSLTATFTPGAIYNWFGPNSFTSSVQNPTISPVTIAASGVYSAYIGLAGCSGPTVTLIVSVTPLPAAPTAANNSTLCAGSTLSLTANPGGALSYSWTGPNSFTANVQNPTIPNVSVLASGDYSVTQNILGCDSPPGITSVTINPIPNPPNGISNSPVCGGGALTFTLNPSGGIYFWSGPNSFTSTLQNPTISPAPLAANGNYTVTYTVLGCTSAPLIITASVGAIPNAADASGITPLCSGSTLSLSANFTANVTYNWTGPNSFTSNLQNPIIVGATTLAAGVYTVVTSINGCTGPASTVAIVVDELAVIDAGLARDTICATAIIPLNGTLIGNGYTSIWTTAGSGTITNPSTLITTYTMSPADTTAGLVKFYLSTVGGGCPTQKDSIEFVVLRAPYIDVASVGPWCKNRYVVFTSTITGVTNTGTWTTSGSGSFNPNIGALNGLYIPSSADTAAGFVKLRLETTNNKGCLSRLDSLMISFITSPIANFTSNTACSNKPITFTDLSIPTASIATYNWNFGDGVGTSGNANPTYSYATSSTYTIQHIVVMSNGCVDTVEKTLKVNVSPLADFTSTSTCVGKNSMFFSNSTISSGSISAYNWNFGDGGNSTLKDPIHIFPNTGTFSITYTVTSDSGCVSTTVKVITVTPRPTANFTMSPNPVTAYENVFCTDQSIPAGSPIVGWYWNFANGTTGNVQNPTTMYSDKGIFTVTLAITDAFGCSDTVTNDIMVALPPLVPSAFTPNGDGHNDILFVKGGPFKKMTMSVYNNWGELIFVSDNQDNGWDGKYKGQNAPLGVYVWILDVEQYNGVSVRKTGDVTILK